MLEREPVLDSFVRVTGDEPQYRTVGQRHVFSLFFSPSRGDVGRVFLLQ